MTGTVTAEYLTYGGAPAKGTVTFGTNTTDQQLRDPDGNVVYTGPRKFRLVAGELEVELPATDDAAFAETGWQYWARIELDGAPPALRWFELPDGDTVNLADIAGELAPGDPLTHPLSYADVVADIQDPESVIGEALSASYVALAPKPTGVAGTDGPILTALNEAAAEKGGRIILQPGDTNVPYKLNEPLVAYAGVTWQGVPPTLWQQERDLPDYLADGIWDYTSGTWFQGDGTFAAFEANTTPLGSFPTALGDTEIPGFGVTGLGFDNFTYGIHVGAENTMGLTWGVFDELAFKRCSAWSVKLINFLHLTIGSMRSCESLGGFYFGAEGSGGPNIQPGNTRMGELYVQTKQSTLKTRGIVFATLPESFLNHIDVRRPQVNRFNAGSVLSVSAGFTNASANVTVPDGTQFQAGMAVRFTTTNYGVTANRIYMIQSVVGNTLTIGTANTYGGITATGTGSLTLETYGFPNIEILSANTGGFTTSTLDNIDIESEGTSVGLYVEFCGGCRFNIAVKPASAFVDVVGRSLGYSVVESRTSVKTDFDGESATSMHNGLTAGALFIPLQGVRYDTVRGSKQLALWEGYQSASLNYGDLEARAEGLLYPNRGIAERIRVANGDMNLNATEQGVIVFDRAANSAVLLPIVTTDVGTPTGSNVGCWFEIVNFGHTGTGVVTVSTDGGQTFNKTVGLTSIAVAVGKSLRVTAMRTNFGDLTWFARSVDTNSA